MMDLILDCFDAMPLGLVRLIMFLGCVMFWVAFAVIVTSCMVQQ